MTIKERAEIRRKQMAGNLAQSYEEAEDWDLEFWRY